MEAAEYLQAMESRLADLAKNAKKFAPRAAEPYHGLISPFDTEQQRQEYLQYLKDNEDTLPF